MLKTKHLWFELLLHRLWLLGYIIKDDKERIENLEEKLQKLVEGGYVGVPRATQITARTSLKKSVGISKIWKGLLG